MSTSTNSVRQSSSSNEIFIGKKPLMTYVTATLVQLANEPTVVIKARGKEHHQSGRCGADYCETYGHTWIQDRTNRSWLETVQSDDGKVRNVSTIDVPISRAR